jgi:starch-binding outer membrane protein SusE/F
MNNIFKTLIFLVLAGGLFSCKKDEKQVVYKGGTAPVLTASTAAIPLSFINKDLTALTINWTNPDYQFNTGLSSQDVSYTIEIDTTGANFTSPLRQRLTVSKDLSKTFTQGELNGYLLNQLLLVPDVTHQVEMRVISTLAFGNARLASNVLKYTIKPFSIPPVVTPPSANRLFMVGSATPGGWSNPVPVPSQEFTRVSNTLYELTVNISSAGSYLLLPVNGSWDAKYGGFGGNNSNNVNGGDFREGGSDLLAPAASGSHKIVIDFQRGKFTVTKL